jgi:hypothetical protein
VSELTQNYFIFLLIISQNPAAIVTFTGAAKNYLKEFILFQFIPN